MLGNTFTLPRIGRMCWMLHNMRIDKHEPRAPGPVDNSHIIPTERVYHLIVCYRSLKRDLREGEECLPKIRMFGGQRRELLGRIVLEEIVYFGG